MKSVPPELLNKSQLAFIAGLAIKYYNTLILSKNNPLEKTNSPYKYVLILTSQNPIPSPLKKELKENLKRSNFTGISGLLIDNRASYPNFKNVVYEFVPLNQTANNYSDIGNLVHTAAKTYIKTTKTSPTDGKKYMNFLHNYHSSSNIAVANPYVVAAVIIFILTQKKATIPIFSKESAIGDKLKILKKEFQQIYPSDFPIDDSAPLQINYTIKVIYDINDSNNKKLTDSLDKEIEGLKNYQFSIDKIDIKDFTKIRPLFESNSNEHIVGIYVIFSSSEKNYVYKYNNQEFLLFDFLNKFSANNKEIPIIYYDSQTPNKKYQFEWGAQIGKNQYAGSGVMQVWLQAIDRLKIKNQKFKQLKTQHTEQLKTKEQEFEQLKTQHTKQLETKEQKLKHSNRLIIFMFSLIVVYLSLHGNYDALFHKSSLVQQIHFQSPSIKLEYSAKPFYIKTLKDKLYISDNRDDAKYFQVYAPNNNNSLTTIYLENRSHDFAKMQNSDTMFITTSYNKKLLVGTIDTTNNKFEIDSSKTINYDVLGYPDAISISPNNKKVVVSLWNGNHISLIHLDKNYQHEYIRLNDNASVSPTGVAFISNTKVLVSFGTSNSTIHKIVLIDINDPSHKIYPIGDELKLENYFHDIKYSDALNYALTCSKDKKLFLFQISDEQDRIDFKDSISIGREAVDLSISPSGRYTIIAYKKEKRFDLFEIDANLHIKLVQSFSFEKEVTDFSNQGLSVDWKNRLVYIPNRKTSEILIFELPEVFIKH